MGCDISFTLGLGVVTFGAATIDSGPDSCREAGHANILCGTIVQTPQQSHRVATALCTLDVHGVLPSLKGAAGRTMMAPSSPQQGVVDAGHLPCGFDAAALSLSSALGLLAELSTDQ